MRRGRRKSKHKKRSAAIIFAVLLIAAVASAFTYASDKVRKVNNVLPDNVYINGINLGGKTLEEAGKIIEEKAGSRENKKIKVVYKNGGQAQSREFTLKELGYYTNVGEVKSDIEGILNNDLNFIEKFQKYKDIQENGRKYEIKSGINYDDFINALKVFDDSSLQKPVNAEYKFKNGQVIIVDGQSGYKFDFKGLYDNVLDSIDKNQTEFQIKKQEVEPEITAAELKSHGAMEKMTSFTTKFTASNKPRSSNIRLAGRIIDGTVIAPGEVFSFNDVVGERTLQRGFQVAGVYIKGRVDEGIGGGICQVSTTLYNAALLADLEIVERRNHSLTVPYVPLSRDAAVSYGTQDFKFRNNTSNYILIHAVSTNSTITFELYGTKSNKRIELISTTLEQKEVPVEYTEDNTLEMGKEVVVDKGHAGYKSRLVKRVYVAGKLVKEETVSNDRYLTSPKMIKKGTKDVIQEQPEKEASNV